MSTKRKIQQQTATPLDRPLDGYGRNSKLGARERGNNASIGEQRAEIPKIAKTYGVPFSGVIFEEEDTSGADFDRPEWQKLVERVRRGESGGVIALDLDRATRGKTAEVLMMIEEIESLGGQVYDRSGRLTMSSADAEMLLTLKAMLNRGEWVKRRRYLLTSVSDAIGRGVHLQTPFGYERSNGKGSPLAIVEHEARVVRLAFEVRAQGGSWQQVADAMQATGILPRPYRRHGVELQSNCWTWKTARQVVTNEVYAGTAWNGEHRFEDAHPAIVGRDLFDRVQRTRGSKREGRSGDGHLLNGLARCATCGYVMRRTTTAGKGYYQCPRRECPSRVNVSQDQLDAYVRSEFARELSDVQLAAVADDSPVAEAEERVAQAAKKVGRALDVIAELDDVSKSERAIFDERLEVARAELKRAEAGLTQARLAARGIDLPADLTADTFERMGVAEQRHLIGQVFGAVVVRRANSRAESVDNVGARVRFVSRDEAPTNSVALIDFVVADVVW